MPAGGIVPQAGAENPVHLAAAAAAIDHGVVGVIHAALESVSAKDALWQGKGTLVLQVAESLARGDFA